VLMVPDAAGDKSPDDLRALVEDLVGRVAGLQAEVVALRSGPSTSAAAATKVPVKRRTSPTDGEPVDLVVLAKWVNSLQVRYATESDWLKPCWWRHGFVVEELAALRQAWLAVYDANEPIDQTAGLKWHEDAEKCRERIRKTVSIGSGCSAVSHLPDDPVTDDRRWIEECAALGRHQPGECASSHALDRGE
jgi:hypothetical protein